MEERRRVVLLMAATAILLVLVRADRPPAATPPCPGCNVLMVMVDTLPASHVGAYGYWRNTTPNIDAFAARSWLFEKAISPSYFTSEVDASIQLGEPAKTTWILDIAHDANYFLFREKRVPLTLQGLLGMRGYSTTSICSNDCDFWPGTSEGFQKDVMVDRMEETYLKDMEPDRNDPFSRLSAELPGANKPFFVFYRSLYLHYPYNDPSLPPFFYEGYGGKLKNASFFMTTNRLANGVYSGQDTGNVSWQLDRSDMAWVAARYDDKLRWMDANLGRLFGFLEEGGYLNNTIVIVSSEHGDELGESEVEPYAGHNSISANTVHIPLIVYIPNGGSGRIPRIVQLTDVYRTVLGSLGMAQEDGEARLGLFDGGRKYAFSFDFGPGCVGGSVITEDGKRVQKLAGGAGFTFTQIDFGSGDETFLDEQPPKRTVELLESELAKLCARRLGG